MTSLIYQIFNLFLVYKISSQNRSDFPSLNFPIDTVSQFVPIIALVIATFAIVEAAGACGGSEAHEHMQGADAKIMQK